MPEHTGVTQEYLPLRYLIPLVTAAIVACVQAHAKEPSSLLGAGATRCEAFLKLHDNADTASASRGVFAWVQGWFSAKNYYGDEDGPVTVGASVSTDTLQSMLVDECRAKPKVQVYLAAESIYERLKQKGQ